MSTTVEKYAAELMENANRIASRGKGIFAADDSIETIGKWVEANPKAVEYLSGIILSEDKLDQNTAADKSSDSKVLNKAGVLPGIKFKFCNVRPDGTMEYNVVETLKDRCEKYHTAGVRFAEFGAALKIDGETESLKPAIQQIAEGLACYALICQENRLVPIVEPEVHTDGGHDIAKCADVTQTVLAAVYKALNDHHVLLEGTLLKTNMVTPGSESPNKVTADNIAQYTVKALQRTVPVAVPGIVFSLGRQLEENKATENLNAINKPEVLKRPWTLSFSFGRALQQIALETRGGKKEKEQKASSKAKTPAEFLAWCKANSEATLRKHTGGGSSSDGGSATEYYPRRLYNLP